MVSKRTTHLQKLVMMMAFSVAIEINQYILDIGTGVITDVILGLIVFCLLVILVIIIISFNS